jgi:hypothetical protein
MKMANEETDNDSLFIDLRMCFSNKMVSQGKIAWIQEDTERDYSQTEYGKNALVGDGGNRENPRAMLIQGDDA